MLQNGASCVGGRQVARFAQEGDYGYEPLGVEHHETSCVEETIITFTSYGPVVFPGEDGRIEVVLDWEFVKKQAEGFVAAPSLSVPGTQAA